MKAAPKREREVVVQKRGWTRRHSQMWERPVSIRPRRVHSPLMREWGPTARRAAKPRRQVVLHCLSETSARSATTTVRHRSAWSFAPALTNATMPVGGPIKSRDAVSRTSAICGRLRTVPRGIPRSPMKLSQFVVVSRVGASRTARIPACCLPLAGNRLGPSRGTVGVARRPRRSFRGTYPERAPAEPVAHRPTVPSSGRRPRRSPGANAGSSGPRTSCHPGSRWCRWTTSPTWPAA